MDEALEMLGSMASEADRDAEEEDQRADECWRAGNDEGAHACQERAQFWDGWAEGLRTLENHIRTGVKVTCFPLGNCSCHPLNLKQ